VVRTAFKEWAIVVDALGRGDQIVILRKGGISEGRGGFQVDHPEFLLFPTLFHQQRDAVLPPAQKRYDAIAPHLPTAEKLRIEFLAKVAEWRRVDALADAERLRGQHIWRDEVIADRFEWGRARNIFAISVRVLRLPTVIELPMAPAYAGCKSWIELERDVDVRGATPVLDDKDFAAKLAHFASALEPVAK
jgi:hypothetical protein